MGYCRETARGVKSFVAYCRCTLFVLNEIFRVVEYDVGRVLYDVDDDLWAAKRRGWSPSGGLLRARLLSALIDQTACWESIHNEQQNISGQD